MVATNLKRKVTWLSGAAEIVSFCMLVVLIVVFAKTYNIIEGENRLRLAVVFWLGMLTYSLLFVLKRFPSIFSYPTTLTAENVEAQARLAKLMLSTSTFLSTTVFALSSYHISLAKENLSATKLLMIIFFVAMVLNYFVYIIAAKTKRARVEHDE